MRYLLVVICLLAAVFVTAQNDNYKKMQNPLKLSMSAGTIRHKFTTTSENNKIRGVPSYDYVTELALKYYINEEKLSISTGVQLISFTNIYETNSTNLNEFDSRSRTIIGGTGYFKVFFNYHYYLKFSDRIYIGGIIGPSINFHRTFGEYDNYQSFFQETENNQIIKTVITSYSTERIKKQSYSAQFGLNFEYRFRKGSILYLSSQYNIGFDNFNKTNVLLNINGNYADKAIIYSKGSGLNILLGFSFPINL